VTAFPGYGAQVNASGTKVNSPGITLSNIDGGAWKKYQSSTLNRQTWDPFAAITVYVDGVSQNPSTYVLNRLFGSVTFNAALTSGNVVTADIYKLPMTAVAAATAVDFSVTRSVADATTFASAGWTERQAVLLDSSGSISRFTQMDGLFQTAVQAGSLLLVSYFSKASNAQPDWRAWALFNKHELKGDPASLQTAVASWVGTTDADERQVATGP
jgi:hypothetical protein